MRTKVFKIGEQAKLDETCEAVVVREQVPIGTEILYRVEKEDGTVMTVRENRLRPNVELDT